MFELEYQRCCGCLHNRCVSWIIPPIPTPTPDNNATGTDANNDQDDDDDVVNVPTAIAGTFPAAVNDIC